MPVWCPCLKSHGKLHFYTISNIASSWRESQGDSMCYRFIGYYPESFLPHYMVTSFIAGMILWCKEVFSTTFLGLWSFIETFEVHRQCFKNDEGPSCEKQLWEVPMGTQAQRVITTCRITSSPVSKWLSHACFLLLFDLLVFPNLSFSYHVVSSGCHWPGPPCIREN